MESILTKDVTYLLSKHTFDETKDKDIAQRVIDTMYTCLSIARSSKGAHKFYKESWPKSIVAWGLITDETKPNQFWWFASQVLSMLIEKGMIDFLLFMKDRSRFLVDTKGTNILYNGNYARMMPLEVVIQDWESRTSLPEFIYRTFRNGFCFKKSAEDPNPICSMCDARATFSCIQTDETFCNLCSRGSE